MGPGAGGAGSPPEPDADGGRNPHLLRPTPVSLVSAIALQRATAVGTGAWQSRAAIFVRHRVQPRMLHIYTFLCGHRLVAPSSIPGGFQLRLSSLCSRLTHPRMDLRCKQVRGGDGDAPISAPRPVNRAGGGDDSALAHAAAMARYNVPGEDWT